MEVVSQQEMINRIKNDYEFYHRMSERGNLSRRIRETYKFTSIVLAQMLEAFNVEFERHDYSYEP